MVTTVITIRQVFETFQVRMHSKSQFKKMMNNLRFKLGIGKFA